MKDKRADISQIQAYLKGELDSKAMHQLEREAQADPFLADALDGYANTADQQDNLAALKQLLQQRTEPKVRRIVPWTTIAIAASVVGFVIVAGLFFMRNNIDRPSAQVAVNEPAKVAPLNATPAPAATDTAKETTPLAPINEDQKPLAKAKQPARTPQVVLTDKQTSKPAEINTPEANDVLKKSSDNAEYYSNNAMPKRQDTILGGEHIAINKNPSALTVLKSKADGATYRERERQSASSTAALMAANLPTGLSGKVLDNSGAPLPGASVQVVGKPNGAVTDANGRFTLRDVKPDDQVAYGYIGYDRKVFPAKTGDSVKVRLDQSNSSLSEVVVTQVDKRNGPKASPIIGWSAYADYLKRETITDEGDKTGSVEVSFTVEANGNISGIKTIKSLNAAADAKAIKLIQNGPRWFGNLNGKPEVVKVTVKFSPKD